MKLLREYIRTLLTEDAKGVEDLPRGVYIKIWSAGGDDVSFKFTNYRGSLSKKTKISADDCSQDIVAAKIKHGDDWTQHPLSKRYTKPPRTIELLRKAGKLIEKA